MQIGPSTAVLSGSEGQTEENNGNEGGNNVEYDNNTTASPCLRFTLFGHYSWSGRLGNKHTHNSQDLFF